MERECYSLLLLLLLVYVDDGDVTWDVGGIALFPFPLPPPLPPSFVREDYRAGSVSLLQFINISISINTKI